MIFVTPSSLGAPVRLGSEIRLKSPYPYPWVVHFIIEKKLLIFVLHKAYIFPLWYGKPHMKFFSDQTKFRGGPRMQVLGDFGKISNNNSLA